MARVGVPRALRKRWVAVLAAVAIVALAGWLAESWLLSPARLTRLLREQLEQAVGGDVRVASAEMGLLSRLVVRGIELRAGPEAEPWASVAEVSVVHRIAPLLLGRLEIDSVRVVEPRLVVNDDSIERLTRLTKGPPGKGPFPGSITVEGGVLRIERSSGLPGIEEVRLGPISLRAEDPDRSGRLLLIAGQMALAAGPVAFDARLDGGQHSLSFGVSSGSLAIGKLPLGWLPEGVRARREVRELSGLVAGDGRGWLVWGEGKRASLDYVLRLRFEDVAFPSDDFPTLPVHGLAGEATLRPGRAQLTDTTGRLGQARLDCDDLQLTFGAPGQPASLFVRGTVLGTPLDQSLRAALPKDLRDVWDGLGIASGSVDATVRYSREGEAKPVATVELDLRHVQLEPRDHPYPLPPLDGTVRYESDRELVTLDDVEGSDGSLSVETEGVVRLAGNAAGYSLAVKVSGLELDERLHKVLTPDLAATWEELGIGGGSLDLDLTVAQRRGQPPRLSGTIDARDGLVRPRAFPYDFPPLTGRLHLLPTPLVQIDGLTGTRGGLIIRATGSVDLAGKSPLPDLRVAATSLPLDPSLRAALPKDWQERWTQYRPNGSVDAQVRVATDPQGGVLLTGSISPHGCSASVPDVPRRLDGITGTIQLQADAVQFESMAARSGSADLRADATWRLAGAGRLEALSLTALSLDVDPALVAALPASVRDALKPHDPAGNVDVRLSYFDDGKEPARTRLAATLHGLAASVGAGGPRLTALRGDLASDGRTLILTGLRGRMGGAPIEVDGAVGLADNPEETAIRFHLPLSPIEPALVAQLPKSVADPLRSVGATGTLSASGVFRARGKQAEVYLNSASFDIGDIALATVPPIGRLDGTATWLAAKGDAAGPGGQIAVNLGRGRVAGLSLEDISALATLAAGSLDVRELGCTLYAGRVAGELRVEPFEPLKYVGQARIAHLDLESLAVDLGLAKDPPSGWMRGTVQFHGQGEGLEGLELEGTCKVDRGRIYHLPLIVSVFNVFNFQLPGEGALTSAHVDFRLRDRTLQIEHAVLAGKTMPIGVTGTIELKKGVPIEDQKIDLLFTAARERQILDKLPVVGWIKSQSYDRLTGQFLQARVTGTLAKPDIQYLLKPIVKPIEEFWDLLGRVTAEAAAPFTPK